MIPVLYIELHTGLAFQCKHLPKLLYELRNSIVEDIITAQMPLIVTFASYAILGDFQGIAWWL